MAPILARASNHFANRLAFRWSSRYGGWRSLQKRLSGPPHRILRNRPSTGLRRDLLEHGLCPSRSRWCEPFDGRLDGAGKFTSEGLDGNFVHSFLSVRPDSLQNNPRFGASAQHLGGSDMLESDGLIRDFCGARRPFSQIQTLHGYLCKESKEIQGFRPGHQDVTGV
jgi:hypothetical protein